MKTISKIKYVLKNLCKTLFKDFCVFGLINLEVDEILTYFSHVQPTTGFEKVRNADKGAQCSGLNLR